jgi:hypothetical protein
MEKGSENAREPPRTQSREQARQRLRQVLRQKQQRRMGGTQEILVPAPVPGELTPAELQRYQKQMQKLVQKKGRGAIMDKIGVTDRETKLQLATAMTSGDTGTMTEIMKRLHTPDPTATKGTSESTESTE